LVPAKGRVSQLALSEPAGDRINFQERFETEFALMVPAAGRFAGICG